MMRHAALAIALVSGLAFPAFAGNEVSAIAPFLREDRGARIPAYGGAGTSLGGDLFAIASNPASIAGLDRYAAAFEHDAIVLDISGNYASIGGPFRERAAWGISYAGIDYGSTLRTTTSDPFGASNSSFSGNDLALGLHGGYRLGRHGQYLLGAAYKFYQMRIDNFSATGSAWDVGFQWDIRYTDATPSGFRVGAALLNLGSDATIRTTKEALPATWRVGGSYAGKIIGQDIEYALDAVGGRGIESHIRAGFGWTPLSWLTLRVGGNTDRDFLGGVSGGFGVKWNDLRVDYAWLPFGDLGNRNRLSLAYDFGAPRPVIGPPGYLAPGIPPKERPSPARPQPIEPKNPLDRQRSGATPVTVPPVVFVEPPVRFEAPPATPAEPPLSQGPVVVRSADARVVKETEGPTIVRRPDAARIDGRRQSASVVETLPVVAPVSSGPVVLRAATPPSVVAPPLSTGSPSSAPSRADAEILVTRANSLTGAERYDEAIALYQQALALDPASVRIHFNLATAHFLNRDYVAALPHYRTTLAMRPNDSEAHFYMGVCQYRTGDIEGAAQSWQRTVQLDPSNENAKRYLESL